MSIKSPSRSENEGLHGEPEIKPLFGPGSNNSLDELERIPTASQDDIDRIKSAHLGGEKLLSRQAIGERESQAYTTPAGLLPGGLHTTRVSTTPKDTIPYKEEKGRSFYARFTGKINKKNSTGLVLGGVLVFSGVSFFSFAQGPLQAVHLMNLLSNPFRHHEKTVSFRTQGFYRYHKTGNIGETRLGFMASKMNQKFINDMDNAGITIESNQRTGQAEKVRLDTGKNPEFSKFKTFEEQRAAIAKAYGIPESQVRFQANGTGSTGRVLSVDTKGSNISLQRSVIVKSLKLTYTSGSMVGLATRVTTQYYQAPSLFSPIQRAEAKAAAKIDQKITDNKKARREAQLEENKKVTGLSPEAKARLTEIKSKLSVNPLTGQGISGALSLTGNLCLVKDVASGISAINRENGPVPSTKGALRAMAVGSQVQSGQNLTAEQLGDFVSTFSDESGKTIWQGRALNALGGKNSGVDLDEDVKQSFSPKSTTAEIEKGLDSAGADIACSTGGQIFQGVVGVALLATTGGAGNIIVKGSTSVASGLIVQRIVGYLTKIAADDSVADKVLAGGPLGGNLLAYGAEEGSGVIARSMGGVAFSESASKSIRTAELNDYKGEFNSRGFASRVFDARDERSLIASAMRSTSGKSYGTLASSMVNPSHWFSSFENIISSTVNAQEGSEVPYEWILPKYGFSDAIMDDPKYDNPFDNADRVATLLSDSGNLDAYNDRVGKCFGVKLNAGTNGWEVISEKETNPASKEYQEGNCSDESDENWVRVRLFILDSKTMSSFACIEGDITDSDIQEACAEFSGNKSGPSSNESQEEGLIDIQPGLDQIIEKQRGDVGVSVIELSTKARKANVKGDKQFKSASIYKTLSAYSIIKKIENEKIAWNSPAGGVRPETDAGGGPGTIENCFRQMIIWSSDTCGEYLSRTFVSEEQVDNDLRSLGLRNTQFSGGTNLTTANDVALFLSKLELDELSISQENRNRLIGYMKEQRFRDGVAAGAKVETANKVGWLLESSDGPTLNDAGVVYSPDGKYVLAILTQNNTEARGNDARSFVNRPVVWSNIKTMTEEIDALLKQSGGRSPVIVDGYAFPIAAKRKGDVKGLVNLPCTGKGCHHDNTYAYDIGVIGYGPDRSENAPVYAISDGILRNVRYERNGGPCNQFQLDSSKDGYWYWYGHLKFDPKIIEGQEVKAGDQIGVVGPTRCADGTPPHLHIDRGSPRGQPGGLVSARDPGIQPIINGLYERLPD